VIRTSSDNGLHLLEYGSNTIPFSVEFRRRQRLSISVHPDGQVTVISPVGCSIDEVHARVQKRAHWIAKQRAHFEVFRPLPQQKRYLSGETHLYLGKQYRLKIRRASEESVKLKGCYLHICTPGPVDSQHVAKLLDTWYFSHARNIFAARLGWCLKNAVPLDVGQPVVSIRRMAQRWGSCTQTGNITLNIELAKTPLYCIEYVIMHELCHLRVHNHRPAYYRLLTRCMPDWKQRKSRLDTFVI